MNTFTKLLAATVLSGAALAGSAQAQYQPTRSGYPTTPALTLPKGVHPVPTFSPTVPTTLPGGWYPPRPYPNPGPFPPPAIDIDYKVYYRDCPRSPWRFYGIAETGREARRVERYLESQGYEVSLVEKFDTGYDGYRR